MSLKDAIAADSKRLFLSVRDFAETVAYTPKGGAAADIAAVIDRHPQRTREADNDKTLAWEIEVFVAREDVAAVTIGGDFVKLPRRVNEAPTPMRVTAIVGQDEGLWQLGLSGA